MMKKAAVQLQGRPDGGATLTVTKPNTPGVGADRKVGGGGNLLMKKLLAKNKSEEASGGGLDSSREESAKRNSVTQGSRSSISGGSASLARMSIGGMMASRRFAKRLMSRAADKRESTAGESAVPTVLYEPTYRLDPKTKFEPSRVLEVVKEVIEGRIKDMKYNPRIAPNMNRILGDEVKDKVKKLNYDRYKIIVIVMIGEKKGQGIQITSRCSWDDKVDNFVTHTFQNKHIFCTCSVYGTYKE